MEIKRSRLVDLSKVKIKKDDYLYHSKGSSFLNLNAENIYRKNHNYIELTNQGSLLLIKNKYNESLDIFKKALDISIDLRDQFKINETNCNIGIVYFFSDRLNEANNQIKPSFDYIYSICSNDIGNNNLKNLFLLCKAGANLCMCQLVKNSENNNCINLINIIIDIISKEKDLYKQLCCTKYLNNILFNVNSLLKNKDDSLKNNYYLYEKDINNINEDKNNKVKKLIFDAFINFVSTLNFDSWINSLKAIYQKMEQLNDNMGIFYILFNQQIGICLKNFKTNIYLSGEDEENKEAKIKLKSILQAMNQNKSGNEMNNKNKNQINQIITDVYIDNIIEDYKSKLFIIGKIYQILFSFENKLISNIHNYELNNSINYIYNNNNQNIKSEYFLKLLLNYAKNDLNHNIQDKNLKNNLIIDINETLNLINSKQIDISKINIFSFDPEIAQSLPLLFNNFFNVFKIKYYKTFFKNFKNYNKNSKIIKKDNKIKLSKNPYYSPNADKKLLYFFEMQYYGICKGEKIVKINYHSLGVKEHFYQVDYKEDSLNSFIFDKSSKKLEQIYDFDEFLKIVNGIKTINTIKKINIIKKKYTPYKYLSIISRKRSIDLILPNEESSQKWFYGLYHYCNISNRKYKISSCTKFLLFKIKCKMMNQLKGKINKIDDIPFSSVLKHYLDAFRNII